MSSFLDNMIVTNIICHCRTEHHIKTIRHTWSIADFWTLQESIRNLLSDSIYGLGFQIEMLIKKVNNKKKVLFYSDSIDTTKINPVHSYRVYIQTSSEEEALSTQWKKTLIKHRMKLYSINFEHLRENKEKYVSNNTLTVCFEFEIFENIFHKTVTEIFEIEPSVQNMLPVDKTDIITFVIGADTEEKRLLYVSKHLLCWKSKVFKKMFDSNLEESKINQVFIKDIKYDSFKHLISYVETGGLSDLRIDMDCNYINTIYDILAAANKYDMADLMLICEKRLIQCMTKQNAATHLNVAITHNGKYLENYAIKFIKLYINEIKYFKDFVYLLQKCPTLIIKITEQKLQTIQSCFAEYSSDSSFSAF